jgi:hypothetical protein
MTQALALAHHLRAAGHSIEQVWVGLGPGWRIPGFFSERIGCAITPFRAPTHALNGDQTRVSTAGTVLDFLLALPAFVRGAGERNRRVHHGNTDVVVGFFDAIGGLSRVFGSGVPAVTLGHHYVLFHAAAPRIAIPAAERLVMRELTRLTAYGAADVLALSFTDLESGVAGGERRGPAIVPPLLRPEVGRVQPRDGGHLLTYAVAPGIGDRVISWQRSRPEVTAHVYVAGGIDVLKRAPGPGCHVHDLDDRAFLSHMGSCRAYAGSAGFESLCEAYYMGKPVLAVPTPGQVEQDLNAVDGARAAAVRAGSWDDLDDFWTKATAPPAERVEAFRRWVDGGPDRIVRRIEAAAARRRAP